MKNSLTIISHRQVTKFARLAIAGAIVSLLITAALAPMITVTHGNDDAPGRSAVPSTIAQVTPSATPISNTPVQSSPVRITIVLGTTQDLQIATGFDAFVMVSPEIATGTAKNRFNVSITALKIGETMLLATYGTRRQTYIIEVIAEARQSRSTDSSGLSPMPSALAGSLTTTYARGSGGGTSLLRQNVDLRQKLSKGRTLRFSGEMFKFFGGATTQLAIARVEDFALNRLSVGLDTPDRTIDIVDSQVNISALTLNNSTIRGFHLSSKTVSKPGANLQAKGIELFAGLARPSLAFFDTNGGKIAGAMIPVITTSDFQARAGLMAISADSNSRQARGGVIFHADAAYAPTKKVLAEAEMSYAAGDISWRARLELKYTKYGASGEMTRFARSSPLNSIGAQSGGRNSEVLSFYWRPVRSLSTAVGYNHTQVSRVSNSQLADYNRSLFFSNVSYAITRSVRITLRYADQKIETAFPGGRSKFAIETRTLSIDNSYKFNSNWSNTIEGRINFNREANADAVLENGFSLREQLRFQWRGSSLTGFLYYNRKSPSLISLIVRNPGLLPPALQAAFALDPADFIRLNRDRIAFLLPGVELPETRSFDAGLRFQKTISRLTISGETRYNAGEIYAVNQKSLLAAVSVGVRLDGSNSLQANLWRSFGRGQSGMTVSYTHQFGSPGDGFRLSSLFGFGKQKVRGRVFNDLNSNGLSDLGEPGLAGMKLQIDGGRPITADKDGRYEFSTSGGSHRVALVSGELGVRLLASTPTEVYVDGRRKLDLDFGVRDHGQVSGRIFNDIDPSNNAKQANAPGLGGVTVTLRSADTGFGDFVLTQVTRPDGTYHFSNIRPGKYLIEIDPASVPANFRIPSITGSSLIVEPLGRSVYDVPIAAQRAVTGVVYMDQNGDGVYTPGIDEAVALAVITVGDKVAAANADGTYIVRNLPAGNSVLLVATADGRPAGSFSASFGTAPETKRGFDLRVDRAR